jgi:glycine oxidase
MAAFRNEMPDCIVIGGGVIGLLTARELRLAGASVTVLERAEPGRESSWAGGGIVSPLYPWRYAEAVTALAARSQRAYPDLCRSLHDATGIDPELEPSGLLIEAGDERERAVEWAQRHAVSLEVLSATDVGGLEPGLSEPVDGTLWLRDVAHVRNPRLVRALRLDVERLGVRVLTGHPVTGFRLASGEAGAVGGVALTPMEMSRPEGRPTSGSTSGPTGQSGGSAFTPTGLSRPAEQSGRSAFTPTEMSRPEGRPTGRPTGDTVEAVLTPHGTFAADTFVVCAGAWSGDLLAPLGIRPEITPVKGQMILFHARPGVVRTIHLAADRYAIPRRDGRVLFGSTLEHSGFDKSTSEEAREELYGIAVRRHPALAAFEIEHHWAGLRPGSPSGIPYIGRHPALANLYVNAGHFRNGIVLGPASARLAADLVLGRGPDVDPTPYALDAYQDR